MARRKERAFVWIPKNMTIHSSVVIGSTTVTDFVIEASFTRGIIGENCGCEIKLENSGGHFTDKFTDGDDIFFYMDYSNGTTVQFKGYIEYQKNEYKEGNFVLKIIGSHLHSKLLDVTVTEEYSDAAISTILKDIIDSYLTGYTYTNVETNSTTIDIKWSNKPFWDCVLDLCKIADYDSYLDNDKDFHFFKKESKSNNNDAVVWNDTLIELRGLGQDSVDVRNKIIVYGEADTLPVVHTSQDTASQATYGVKEKVITESDVVDESQAESYADAEKDALKDPDVKGDVSCFFLYQLNPADMIYVIFPPQKIHSRYRLIKYTFKIPEQSMELFFSKEPAMPKIFKDFFIKELGQETLKNPHKMEFSYNFTFDDDSKIDIDSSDNVKVEEGNLKVTSGTSGIMISELKIASSDITQVHLLIKGEALTGTTYHVTCDNGDTYQDISLDTLEDIDTEKQGTKLRLKIVLNDADTRIDAVALLYK